MTPKNARRSAVFLKNAFYSLLLVLCSLLFVSCLSSETKAKEYYSLGTAYYELKKYPEAENWFTRAKLHKTTKIASEYYLGCIAYETGRYKEAESYFVDILRLDKDNVTALTAAAYTCIKLEKLDKAEDYYRRVLELVPEGYDEGYNYALVLMALGKAKEAEQILVKYNNTESPEALLILARSQKQQGKAEAADAYNASLLKNDNPAVRAEYAAYLAENGLTAKALEEYRKALENETLSEEKKEKILQAIESLETDGKGSAEVKL